MGKEFRPGEGGVTARNPERRKLPILAAPVALGSDQISATIRPGFFPIACWRIDDLRFAFDSSFVRPTASDEFRELFALRPPEQKATKYSSVANAKYDWADRGKALYQSTFGRQRAPESGSSVPQ